MSALSIKNLTKNFGLAEVICGVDLEVEKGEIHAVIGPNGPANPPSSICSPAPSPPLAARSG